MNIIHFDDLLQAARQQTVPQRLLLVFARAELPDHPTAEQRADFAAGHGGALVPAACVDKSPHEVSSFAALAAEAAQMLDDWTVVFAASLSGRQGQAPTTDSAQAPLEQMVAAIRAGQISPYIPFDRTGDAIRLQ
ncbi:MAG: hypothetical protein RJA36_1237 [Pseudomonadota bacterium]|jgi:hypothetical protein